VPGSAGEAEGEALFLVDPLQPSTAATPRTTARRLAEAAAAHDAAQRAADAPLPAAHGLVLAPDARHVRFTWRGKPWRWALATGAASPVPEAEAARLALEAVQRPRRMWPINGWDRPEIPSPDGRSFASYDGWNLALRTPGSATRLALTHDGSEDRPWLLAGEILVGRGSEWHADGRRLVVRQMDLTRVPGTPIVDALSGASERVSRFRYWARAGEPLPQNRLFVLDVQSKGRVELDLGSDAGPAAEVWTAFLDWRPGTDEVWFFTASRDFSRVTLRAADARTGASRVVLEERRDDGFVFFPFTGSPLLQFTPDGRRFVWWSDRESPAPASPPNRGAASAPARAALWLHEAADGRMVRRLSPEGTTIASLVRLDTEGRHAFAMAHADPARPADTKLVRLRLDEARIEVLTPEPGQHRVAFAPDGRFFTATHADLQRPPATVLRSSEGALVATLASGSGRSPAGLEGATAEAFELTLPGGVPMSGVILKPPGFDPARRWPVIERLYGGMQSTAAPRGWLGRAPGGNTYVNLLQAYLRAGFVVIAMDGPGTPGRTRAHQMASFGIWPQGIARQHAQAIEALAATRPWLDLERLGLDGNSWGGFVGLHALVELPRRYRAAALTVPQTDPHDHISWIEFQLGTEAANPDGYAAARVLHRVPRIQAQLLLVAGTTDANVPYSNTLKLVNALADAGKPYELVLLPGANHGLNGPQIGDRYPYAVARSVAFFERALKGDGNR
jgi:dipeptidyl aminopeptidase/acylaminoacyl peptidase